MAERLCNIPISPLLKREKGKPMSDLIDRQAAIDALTHKWDGMVTSVFDVINSLPPALPDFDEWCTDCKEYDKERNSCPRWNRVIKETLNDLQEERKTQLSEESTTSDCISRQAAIDVVRKNTFRLTFAEERGCEGHVAWSAEAVYSDVIEGALLELPSAQPDHSGDVNGKVDLIDRRAAIDALWKALYEYEDKTEKQFIESEELDVADWIQHRIFVQNMSDIDRQTILGLPSAQPEIIRCRDCKHWKKTYGDESWSVGDCDVFDKKLVMCKGFCAWAERRTDATTI